MTLYELTAEYQRIMEAMEAETDEEYQMQLGADLAALNEDIAQKGEGYARVIRNLDAEADAYAAEIKRLQAAKKRREDTAERMRAALLESMKAAGAERLETSIGKWSRKLNPPSVVILDAAQVPEKYLVYKDPEVNRRAILQIYKSEGEIIPGTEIVRKESVSFR